MILASLIVYILTLFVLIFWLGRYETKEDFLIAGRNRSTLQLTCSKLAVSIGAGWFLAYTAFGFKFGFSMYYALLAYAVGYILFAWFAVPRIWQWGQKIKALTMGDLVAKRVKSSLAGTAINWIIAIVSLAWVVVSVTGGAKVLDYLNISGGFVSGVLVVCFFILIYLLIAGYKAVVITDTLQAFIILLFSSLIAYALFENSDVSLVFSQSNPPIEAGVVIGLVLYSLSFASAPDRYQLIYASKSIRTAQLGMAIPIIFILALAFVLVVIGQYAKIIDPTSDPDLAFLTILTQALPNWLSSLGLVLFLAAAMSSIDSGVYAISSHTTPHKKTRPSKKELRVKMFITVILVAILSIIIGDIINASILSVTVTLTSAVAMLYILFGGQSGFIFMTSLAFGFGSALIGFVAIGIDLILIPLTVSSSIIGLFGGWLCQRIMRS